MLKSKINFYYPRMKLETINNNFKRKSKIKKSNSMKSKEKFKPNNGKTYKRTNY